jgi:hypothetical protein
VAITGKEFSNWVEGLDYVTGEPRGTHRTGTERKRLRFVEFGINNAKSLSLLESQDAGFHQLMEKIRDEQRQACLAYISEIAVTRVGPAGGQVEVGGLQIEATHVNHVTSRAGDPHYHQHVMVNAKAFDPASGEWRSLHTASLRQHIKAINAEGALALQGSLELGEALAERGLTLGVDGEINELRELTKHFSKRTTQIDANRASLEEKWAAENPGRTMSTRQRNVMKKQAWDMGRKAKSGEVENSEEFGARINAELARYGVQSVTFSPVRFKPTTVKKCDRDALAADALALLEAEHSTWNAADVNNVTRAVMLLEGIKDTKAARDELRSALTAAVFASSYSVFDDDEGLLPLSTTKHLTSTRIRAEERHIGALLAILSVEDSADVVGMAEGVAAGLSAGQVEAVGAMASHQRLAVIIGAAGTGKTTMMEAAKKRLDEQRRTTVLVSPSLQGARVAGRAVDTSSTSLSKLLHANGWRWDEYDRWTREASEPYGELKLDARSVIVVDEASMVTRSMMHALLVLTNETGASLRLVGDPEQLGAVGRGGVIQTAALFVTPVELDLVHRFEKIVVNEAGVEERVTDVEYAALMDELRRGATPEETAIKLFKRGHVVVHADDDARLRAISEETLDKRDRSDAVGVTVATNEMARALSSEIRQGLVDAGRVDDARVALTSEGERIGVGDRVVVRQNDHDIGVANRQQFTVLEVGRHGSLRVLGDAADGSRIVKLPKSYVHNRVELAYAVTAHGQQGATFEHGVMAVDPSTDRAGLYVPLSRGRLSNVAHVVAANEEEAIQILASAIATRHTDDGLDEATQDARVDAVMVDRDAAIEYTRWSDVLSRTALDEATLHTMLRSPAFSSVVDELRQLESAGVDVAGVVPELIAQREFDTAHDPAMVMHWRVEQWAAANPVPAVGPAPISDVDAGAQPIEDYNELQLSRYEAIIGDALEQREPWIMALGRPPRGEARAPWYEAAIELTAYRDRWGVDDTERPFGATSGVGSEQAEDLDLTLELLEDLKRETAALQEESDARKRANFDRAAGRPLGLDGLSGPGRDDAPERDDHTRGGPELGL